MDTMGERIIYLRECLDMRQNERAERIVVTKITMYKYEKNLCEPRAELIGRTAVVLGTTSDFLIGLTSDPAPRGKNEEREYACKRESELVSRYRRLNDSNKARLDERLEILLESQNPPVGA